MAGISAKQMYIFSYDNSGDHYTYSDFAGIEWGNIDAYEGLDYFSTIIMGGIPSSTVTC